jgi:hypothetical protein
MLAEDEGDRPAARKWAESVLAMHPNSFYANWEIANLWVKENNCMNAVQYLERSLTVLDTNADVFSKRRNPAELRGIAASLLKRCASAGRDLGLRK